jgi:hypothetical protein
MLGDRIQTGGGYDDAAIALKRAAEIANSVVFASLQRMAADPKAQQTGLEQAAALANGNQRLTRALTVVALHLTTGAPLPRSELGRFVSTAVETLDALATAIETDRQGSGQMAGLRAALDSLTLPTPPVTAPPLEHSAYSQFARCATELSAMLLAAQAAHAESAAPFPVSKQELGNH